MKSLMEARAESTCQKRITVCVLLDAEGTVLACESNRCAPTGGTCHRLGLTQTKAEYPSESACNWTHAERMAIAALPEGAKPVRAMLYGHAFYCDDCERALRAAGVSIFGVRGATPPAPPELNGGTELIAAISRNGKPAGVVVKLPMDVRGHRIDEAELAVCAPQIPEAPHE